MIIKLRWENSDKSWASEPQRTLSNVGAGFCICRTPKAEHSDSLFPWKESIFTTSRFFVVMNKLRTLNTEYEKSLPWYPDYLRYLMFSWSSRKYDWFFRGSSCEGDAIVMDMTMVLVMATSQLLVRHLCCENCLNISTLILLFFLLYSRCLFPDFIFSFQLTSCYILRLDKSILTTN